MKRLRLLLREAAPGLALLAAVACGTASAGTVAPNALMDWAEVNYTQFFAPGHQPTQFSAPYTYRYYPATQNYLGVAGEDVYVLGPMSNGQLARVGSLGEFTCRVQPQSCAGTPFAIRWAAPAAMGNGAPISGLVGFKVYGSQTRQDMNPVLLATVANPAATGTSVPLASGTWYLSVTAYTDTAESDPVYFPAVVQP